MSLKLNVSSLMKALADKLEQLYLVEGNDAFLVDSCTSAILKKAAATSDVIRLDVMKCSEDELEEPFYSFGFGAPRALLLEGFNAGAIKEDRLSLLGELFADIPDGLVVVLKRFVDDARFSPSKKAAQLVGACERSATVEAVTKSAEALAEYVMRQIKKSGATASSAVARMIAERCGEDLQLTSGETAKLAALANYGEITAKQVEALCAKTPEYGVYDMLGSLERGESKRAFRALIEMLDERTEPLLISAVMNTAFVNLYRCRLARESGRSQGAVASMFDYESGDKKLGIAYNNCMKYSVKQLEEIIEELTQLDISLKSSQVEDRILLEKSVAEIARLVGAKL